MKLLSPSEFLKLERATPIQKLYAYLRDGLFNKSMFVLVALANIYIASTQVGLLAFVVTACLILVLLYFLHKEEETFLSGNGFLNATHSVEDWKVKLQGYGEKYVLPREFAKVIGNKHLVDKNPQVSRNDLYNWLKITYTNHVEELKTSFVNDINNDFTAIFGKYL